MMRRLVAVEFIHGTPLVSMLMMRRILCGIVGNEGGERIGRVGFDIDYVASGLELVAPLLHRIVKVANLMR